MSGEAIGGHKHCPHNIPGPPDSVPNKDWDYQWEVCCKCAMVRKNTRVRMKGCDWKDGDWEAATVEIYPKRHWRKPCSK